jgi:TolB protein
MRADGSEQQSLTPNLGKDYYGQWSPDGQWIIFLSDRDGKWEIYRMRADGSEQQRLTSLGHDYHGQWSPDGRWIIFVSDRDGNYEIYRMRADGSQQQRLAMAGESTLFQVSPPLRRVWRPWLLLGLCGSIEVISFFPKHQRLIWRRR